MFSKLQDINGIEHIFGDWLRKKYFEVYLCWLKVQENEYENHRDFFKNGPAVEDKKLWHHFKDGKLYRVLEIKEYTKINNSFNIYIQDGQNKI